MELSNFKRNSAASAEGRWVDDIPTAPGLRLRVRGLTSPKAIAIRQRKERMVESKDRERGGGFKPEVAQRINREVLAEAILLEWEGLTDNGKPVPYDPELASQILLNPDFEEFAGAVTWAAGVVNRDIEEVEAATSKNSKRSSQAS